MSDPTPAEALTRYTAEHLKADPDFQRRLDRIAAMEADHPQQDEPAWLGPLVLSAFTLASVGALAAVIGPGWWW